MCGDKTPQERERERMIRSMRERYPSVMDKDDKSESDA